MLRGRCAGCNVGQCLTAGRGCPVTGHRQKCKGPFIARRPSHPRPPRVPVALWDVVRVLRDRSHPPARPQPRQATPGPSQRARPHERRHRLPQHGSPRRAPRSWEFPLLCARFQSRAANGRANTHSACRKCDGTGRRAQRAPSARQPRSAHARARRVNLTAPAARACTTALPTAARERQPPHGHRHSCRTSCTGAVVLWSRAPEPGHGPRSAASPHPSAAGAEGVVSTAVDGECGNGLAASRCHLQHCRSPPRSLDVAPPVAPTQPCAEADGAAS